MAETHGFEVVLGSGKKVLFAQAMAGDMEKIQQLAGIADGDSGFASGSKLATAGLKLGIRQIDGKAIDYATLRDGWDSLFSLGEVFQLVNAWNKAHFPGGPEASGNVVAVTISSA